MKYRRLKKSGYATLTFIATTEEDLESLKKMREDIIENSDKPVTITYIPPTIGGEKELGYMISRRK